VRLSGPGAGRVGETLAGPLPKPRRASYRTIRDASGEILDRGLVLYFPAPGSLTGEDVVELQLHGGPRLVEQVLAECVALGAAPARPGEFSQRAFENGRLDLVEAEAIADLVEAESEAALRLAARQLTGRFRSLLSGWRQELLAIVAELFAAIDYPDEVDDPHLVERALGGYKGLAAEMAAVVEGGGQARAVREGVNVVLVGRPNVGKSSLFNALVGYERAIVTEVPGTTRDTIEEVLEYRGLSFRLTDTAGLRETSDAVEAKGVERTHDSLARADVVLVVEERGGTPPEVPILPHQVVIRVAQKADLWPGVQPGWADVVVSAVSGEGLEALKQRLRAGFPDPRDIATANARHLAALRRALAALEAVDDAAPAEVLAQAGEEALAAIGEITGESASAAVVDEVFSRFCLGK
jgi:tRNA modification GTPase